MDRARRRTPHAAALPAEAAQDVEELQAPHLYRRSYPSPCYMGFFIMHRSAIFQTPPKAEDLL